MVPIAPYRLSACARTFSKSASSLKLNFPMRGRFYHGLSGDRSHLLKYRRRAALTSCERVRWSSFRTRSNSAFISGGTETQRITVVRAIAGLSRVGACRHQRAKCAGSSPAARADFKSRFVDIFTSLPKALQAVRCMLCLSYGDMAASLLFLRSATRLENIPKWHDYLSGQCPAKKANSARI